MKTSSPRRSKRKAGHINVSEAVDFSSRYLNNHVHGDLVWVLQGVAVDLGAIDHEPKQFWYMLDF